MNRLSEPLSGMLARGEAAALVTITEAQGSTPREAGATMLVGAMRALGTIGGGQLEYHAIDQARAMLAEGREQLTLDLPLGPQMGQCCGGRVLLAIRRAVAGDVATLAAREAAEQAARHVVLVFGAGHTGRALARQLALLPVAARIIDDRQEELAREPLPVPTVLLDDPQNEITAAPAGAAYLIMTHSHALDYRLAEAALRRGDAAYVGLIGSATKRARFLASYRRMGWPEAALARFACPIGSVQVTDKRPEIIAALAAADLIGVFFARPALKEARHDAA